MTITKNAIANYVGKFYVIFIGIVILPLYMSYLGDEAYGLVGLFTVVQSWMQLLNMGLSPTLGREAAKAKVLQSGFNKFYKILVSYELIFLVITLVVSLAGISLYDWLATSWLNIEKINTDVVGTCIALIFISAVVRFQTSLYRSGIMGLEHQIYVNKVDVFVVSLRFIGGLFLVAIITSDIIYFFVYQLVIACVELVVFRTKLFCLVPTKEKSNYKFYRANVSSTLPFAMGVAYTASIWVLVTQVDKAILSSVLTLSEFGYYTLVALIVGGILQLSQPLAEALRPRLTALAEQGAEEELYRLYLFGTQLVAAITLSASFVIAFNSKALVFMWTGNETAASWAEEVLFWFALGNGLLAVGTFQYYLQFAYGKLKLHVLGSTISACIQIPVIAYAAIHYGAIGAAKAWFGVRLIFFLCWTPIVHSKFRQGFHKIWLLKGVLLVSVLPFLIVLFSSPLVASFVARIDQLFLIAVIIFVSLFFSLVAISQVRSKLKSWFF